MLLAKLEIDDEMKVYFLKIINESVFLKKRKILEVVDRGDYQISQERDKKLFLDDQWDGIIIGNNVLLYNENKILSLFRYYERFRQAADEIVEQIMEKGIISDDSNFLQFVQSQISLQKKLAKAADYGLERIKRERIEELINTGMINLQLDEQGRIVCTTKEEARLVIDVILDNFVSSLITDDKYRAINKMRIQ
ncbi:Kiwa anti-phage protein KwaB-like domain-containing protein [Geobacillus thermoleovorans]|uniref:Kiwa anti-phage protein KwaB-like domain-containing protein n=1 Tax=Geobacillus thermoleovorans TaxID=33941 RepID=UPI002078A4BC|nr:Kiwa anti-phage protein KwaB-like domain-containing protein [Geobacillus thermoleovorans]